MFVGDKVADNYLQDIPEMMIFAKIPKNSIKIPCGGFSYLPDFAYVAKDTRQTKSKFNR